MLVFLTPHIPPSSSVPFLSFIHPSCGVVSLASLCVSRRCAVHSCRAAPLGSNQEIGSHTNAVVLSQQQAAISAHDLCSCHNGALASKKVMELLVCVVLFPLLPTPHKTLHAVFSHPPDKSSPGIRLFCTLTRGRGRKKERG